MKKKSVLVISLCAVVLLASGCGKIPKLQNGQEIVGSIDGKQVTAEELYGKMKTQAGTSVLVNLIDAFIANKEIETDKTANDFAESQIAQLKYQYQQAGQDFNTALIRSGYKNEAAFKEEIILDYKKNKVAENWVKENLTEEEINKYYEEEIFGEISAKHILIKPEVNDNMTTAEKEEAEKKALEKAKEVIKKLNDGAKFEDLVKEYSDDKASVEEGGLIADFTKEEVVKEFFEASNKLETGKYTKEPVKSEFGYHIILKVSQKEKPKKEDVLVDIKKNITAKKLKDDENLSQKVWAEVRKKYNLNIVDTDIKGIYDATISSLK